VADGEVDDMRTKTENNAMRVLHNRRGRAWRERINEVESIPVRCAVAACVWWDFFCARSDTDADTGWKHVDDYRYAALVNDDMGVDPDTFEAALVQVGYPRREAVKLAEAKRR
jgi:hypothetical protein